MSQPINEQKAAIRQKYDQIARWYNLLEALLPGLLGVRKLRRGLLQGAAGNVLEVAVGTGKNLRYYPQACRITAVDLSPGMLAVARQQADHLGLDVTFAVMDAEALDFPAQHFDTVVSSLSLCTFPDPIAALQDMARVCRPDGRLLLLEHGRSDRARLGRWQDRKAAQHAKKLACHWNREPLELVRQAGLSLLAARRTFFGVFHVIEATPIWQHEEV